MAIVANLINAIGGKPDMAGEEFIPKYPGHLPMTIGDLVVGLKKFSRELVHDVFMKIEEPETPLFSRPHPGGGGRRTAICDDWRNSIRRSRKDWGTRRLHFHR